MKRKIGILLLLVGVVLMVGCGNKMTAKEAVRDYLEMYVTLDSQVIDQLNEFVDKEELSNEQKNVYKEILRKEYSSLTYTLSDSEKVEDDISYVNAKIKVIDLYRAQKDALDYFSNHKEEFNDDAGNYDKSKFLDYKLLKMKEATDTTSYEIRFKVVKDGNNWEVSQLSNDDLEKIHGVYNYEE